MMLIGIFGELIIVAFELSTLLCLLYLWASLSICGLKGDVFILALCSLV